MSKYEFVDSLTEQNPQLLDLFSSLFWHDYIISRPKAEIADLQTRNADLEKKNQTNFSQQSENENLRKEISQLKAKNVDLEKEKQAAEENYDNLLHQFREYKETQAEELRVVEDLYRKALHKIERLEENADDEHDQLNETVRSLHDEMEEAKALAVEEEKHSVVFEGEKDAEQSKYHFIKFFVLSMVICIAWLILSQIGLSTDPTAPDGLYNRSRYI